MPFRFPYFDDRPHIPIDLQYGARRRRFLPLLDTGADCSLFHRSDATYLDLPWEKGTPLELSNADGTAFAARQFELTAFIEGMSFPVRICFVENLAADKPLLGRRDFFEQFLITINERERYVELRYHKL